MNNQLVGLMPRPKQWATGLRRTVVFALLWWMLNLDDWASWLVGIPTVLLAVLASLALSSERPWRIHAVGALRFIGYFIWHSLYSGVDVAKRAFHPQLPIHPGLVRYPLRLPESLARVVFVDVISLLPGTLSAALHSDALMVHTLDTHMPILDNLRTLETRVADMFGVALVEPADTQ